MQDLGSQPLERIVDIPVSIPWVYTLPLPYSLQPHLNILLHSTDLLLGRPAGFTCSLAGSFSGAAVSLLFLATLN